MAIDTILFIILAAIAVGSALGMLFSQNAVHAALFLVLNFAVVSVFFLILGAPFIAMVQVTVYAGAIMVLFLFVIMLLGAELLTGEDIALPWQRPLAVLLGLLFIAAIAAIASAGNLGQVFGVVEQLNPNVGGPQEIGAALFQRYLLPFELTSFLLLVAMIGAVILTRDDKKAPAAKR